MKSKTVLFVVLAAILVVGVLALATGAFAKGPTRSAAQCKDGVDNDGDTKVDYPSDPGCSSRNDNNERSTVQCDNGVDDDGDSFIDWPNDSGCSSLTDTTEGSSGGSNNSSSG